MTWLVSVRAEQGKLVVGLGKDGMSASGHLALLAATEPSEPSSLAGQLAFCGGP